MLTPHLPGFAAMKTLSVLAAFQAQDSINSGNSKLLMIFIGIVAISMLAQAAVLVGSPPRYWRNLISLSPSSRRKFAVSPQRSSRSPRTSSS